MAELYSAGEVGVDVVPVLKKWDELKRKLARIANDDLKVNVNGDPDFRKVDSTLERLDGSSISINVKGDVSPLQKSIANAKREARDALKDMKVRLKVDDAGFLRDLNQKINEGKGKLDHFSDGRIKMPQLAVADWDRQFASLKDKLNDLGEEYENLSYRQRTLLSIRDNIGERAKTVTDLQRKVDELGASYDDLSKAMADAGEAEDWDTYHRLSARVEELGESLDSTQASLAKNQGRLNQLRNAYSRIEFTGVAKQLDQIKKSIDETNKSIAKMEGDGSSYESFAETLRQTGSFANDLNRRLGVEEAAQRRSLDAASDNAKAHDMLSKALNTTNAYVNKINKTYRISGERYKRLVAGAKDYFDVQEELSGVVNDANSAMERQRQTWAESLKQIQAINEQLTEQQRIISKAQPLGSDASLNRRINQMRKYLDQIDRMAERGESLKNIDIDFIEHGYGELLGDIDALQENIDETNRKKVIVDFLDANMEAVMRRIDMLEHQRVDVPVEFRLQSESIRDEIAKIKDRVERGDLDAVYELDVDGDFTKLNDKLDEWKRENDEFKMDLDLETALASAHLAWFTRPRTVDIIANFKGSDLGRIVNGMVSGSSGIGVVQNQFQKLVNTMDSLDKFIPRIGILSGVLGSLGSGAVNIAGTIGGIGSSILTMSKAAAAAPAAIIGLGSAFYILKQAWGQKGGTFYTAVDLATTKLGELYDQLIGAFYTDVTPTFRSMADAIAGQLVPGMTGMAYAEGRVVAGMMEMVEQANEAGKIKRIFDDTDEAMMRMVPGMQSLMRAFLDLGDAGSDVLPDMAEWFSRNADSWADWVREMADTGQIQEGLREAAEQGGYLKDSLGSLIGITTGVFGAFAEGENGLQGFSEALDRADRAVNSFKFQETLRTWREGAQSAQSSFRGIFDQLGDDAYNMRDTISQALGDGGEIAASVVSNISQALAGAEPGISRFSTGLREGFQSAFDAIGEAGPMFSSLLSMAGSLSSTFGSVFGSTLRAASPTIQAIATATKAVADAFNALPAPVQAMVGLWATFGKTWTSGITSLKQGMVANIQQTLQYKSMLAQLGVQAEATSMSFRELAQAMMAVKNGQIGGALSGGMGVTARNVAQTKSAMSGLVAVNTKAAGSWDEVAAKAGKTSGALSKVGGVAKTVGSGILGAFGGGWGVAIMAGFTAISSAISDYQSKAQATQVASNNIRSSIEGIASVSKETASSLGAVGSAVKSALSDSRFGETGWNWMSDLTTGFDSVKDASAKTGVSINAMSKAVAGGKDSYEKMLKKLTPTSEAMAELTGQAMNGVIGIQTNTSALVKQRQALEDAKNATLDELKATADENGIRDGYVQSLWDEGTATDLIAAKIQSKTQLEQNHAQALQMLTREQNNASAASIQYAQAAIQYNSMYSGMADQIQNIQQLIDQGAPVWDEQADDFDYTSTAGAAAASTLTQLASSANSYIDAMIDAGKPQEEVIAKQKELRGQFEQTASQIPGLQGQVEQLADTYLTTPESIKTMFQADTEQAKLDTLQYFTLIEDKFPAGKKGSAQRKMVFDAVTSGAITSITQLQTVFDLLTHGADTRMVKLLLNADGDAEWKTKNVAKNLEKLGMEPKTFEWLLNGNGTAEERMQTVRESLSELNLSDKQIQWVLDCIDNVTGQANSAMQAVRNVPTGWTTKLSADGNTVYLANDSKNAVYAIPTEWLSFLNATGNTNAFADEASIAVNAVPPKWFTSIDADGNGIVTANEAEKAVKAIPQKWKSAISASTSGLPAVQALKAAIDSVQSKSVSVTATFYRNFIETHIMKTQEQHGPFKDGYKASGGRISGPGTWTSDSIPTMLSNGEHVIRAASVARLDAKYGRGFLDHLNAYGDIPVSTDSKFRAESQALAASARMSATSMQEIARSTRQTLNTQRSYASRTVSAPNVTQNFQVNANDPELVARMVETRMRRVFEGV